MSPISRGRMLTAVGVATGAALASLAAQVRVARPSAPANERWRTLPVQPRGGTRLGVSFRPLQAEAFDMDPATCLNDLLAYPFQVLRLAAYWNRIETAPGVFDYTELDQQVTAAEDAGKQVILCVGAVKAFGYPEFFVPAHHLPAPLPEGELVDPAGQGELLEAAASFVSGVVARYRDRPCVVGWQVEHEAVDPLGVEHSWRLSAAFAGAEVAAVRDADPSRPVLMNGFLPTSTFVGAHQGWRTRDQGDSLAVATDLADIVGIDYYPRHAVLAVGPRTVYLDGSRTPLLALTRRRALRRIADAGRQVMIAEAQAEPWETATTPPSPDPGTAMYSCPPERLVDTYNDCLSWGVSPSMFLFWGAEYWLLRQRQGDDRYLRAFERVLREA